MKKVIILGLIIFIFGCVSRDKIDEIQQLLENGDHLKAQELFDNYKYKLPKTDYLYFSGNQKFRLQCWLQTRVNEMLL